jgi:hypothetical protein
MPPEESFQFSKSQTDKFFTELTNALHKEAAIYPNGNTRDAIRAVAQTIHKVATNAGFKIS